MKPVSIALFASIALAGIAFAQAPAPKTKIETGALTGKMDGNIAVYRKVPFAAPPVGALRWSPPQKAAAWTGERDASADGPVCIQRSAGSGLSGGAAQSEDCLTLNVFAPKDARNLPVMVWIHGGSNTGGSGSRYPFTPLASQGVVVVSVNYRLGALGFFAHPALTKAAKPGDPLANYGLMDQIAALEWVQRNVAAFGGDAKNVTVFGESAGAMDIYALLGTQRAKGLFSKAILQSNIGWGKSRTLAQGETAGAALATRMGAPENPTAEQLKALPVDKIAAAGGGASVVVDGKVVDMPTFDAFRTGRVIDVPVVVGWNSYEASLRQSPKEEAEQVTDQMGGAPDRWIAARMAAGEPAWLYHFSYIRTANRATQFGAAHAAEIPFAHNSLRRAGAPDPSTEDQAMATLMSSCWVAFAKTGKPGCATGPAWPTYDAQGDRLMEFGMSSGVRTAFRKQQLDLAQAQGMAPGRGAVAGAARGGTQ